MARRGSDNTAIIILIIFCVVCSMSSVFGGAGIYLSLEKRKGDPCEGDDENAEYALDKDLKCRFTECNTGYELDEKGMCALIGRRKPGDICQGRDDNAVYEVDEDLNCDFIQCMAGYSFNDEKRICEVDEAGEAGEAGEAARFPAHWGPEPQKQTRDYRELPGGYGFGSSTLAKWIQKNMDEHADAAKFKRVPPAQAQF